MGRFRDLTGRRFRRLTVVKRVWPLNKGRFSWLCICDCGNEKIVKTHQLNSGGTGSCGCLLKEFREKNKAETHPSWKGGRIISKGYILIRRTNHPNANKSGYIGEHALVMSEYLGRPLKKNESIHHKNGLKCDNRIENLELWTKGHPCGQRVSDMVNFCVDYLRKHLEELLRQNTLKKRGTDNDLYIEIIDPLRIFH